MSNETIRYERIGGLGFPDRERLAVHQPTGTFQAWRSHGAAIGMFHGKLVPGVLAALIDCAGRAVAAGAPGEQDAAPDSAWEVIRCNGVLARLPSGAAVAEPWGEFVARLQELTNDAIEHPRSAVFLDFSPADKRAALVHRGDRPLEIDTAGLSVTAQLWSPDGLASGSWTMPAPPPGASRVTAEPGWSLPFDFDPGLAAVSPQQVLVRAEFIAYDSAEPVPVTILATAPGMSRG